MSTKQSPEPWQLSDCGIWQVSHDGFGSACYQGIKDASGSVVAIVVAHDEELFGDPDTDHNARLIAAVPELLDAANAAYDALTDERADAEFKAQAAQLLFSAIAKATGAAS